MSWFARFALKAVFPSGGALPGIAETDLDGFLERLRAEAPPMVVLGLEAGAILFTFSPLITIGVPLPAFLLPPRLLELHANRLTSHPIYIVRQLMVALKTFAGLCWGADPEVRRAFNLTPYIADPGSWKESSEEALP